VTTKGWWKRAKKRPGGALAEIWRQRQYASRERRAAWNAASDDGMWPMRETTLRVAQERVRRAEERFQRADAAWRAAGCPDSRGKVRASPPPGAKERTP